VDTRAITRIIRESGAMRAGIFVLDGRDRAELVSIVTGSAEMTGRNLSDAVSVESAYVVPATTDSIGALAVVDLGVKRATLGHLAERGFDVHVLPEATTIEEILAIDPVAVFYSNGPGDPSTMTETVALVRDLLIEEIPIFGICFGHQILGRALGFETYKLQFGHRGINQPVLDRKTGKVEITAHNHGFALKAPTDSVFSTVFGPGQVTHICLNDGVVEGLELLERGAFSVQYHPEAAAGPHDASYLFDRFLALMERYPRKAVSA
jgi:carbamoyl-phosphate synthase small subunit